MFDDYLNRLNELKKDVINPNKTHQHENDEEISVFSYENTIDEDNNISINNNNNEITADYITVQNVKQDLTAEANNIKNQIKNELDEKINQKLNELPGLLKKTIKDKLVIGFTVPNNIAEAFGNNINQLKDEVNQSEQKEQGEECLIDPIGLTTTDGTRYDFIVDDGDFDSYEDFLGSGNGISDLLNLNKDGNRYITGEELVQANIKVVRTNPVTKQQVIMSIDEVQAELGGKISIDIASIDANSKENQNFKVDIEKNNGEIQTYTGYSTYENEQYFKNSYNYLIDGIKELDDYLSGYYYENEYEYIRDEIYNLDYE